MGWFWLIAAAFCLFRGIDGTIGMAALIMSTIHFAKSDIISAIRERGK